MRPTAKGIDALGAERLGEFSRSSPSPIRVYRPTLDCYRHPIVANLESEVADVDLEKNSWRTVNDPDFHKACRLGQTQLMHMW